MEVRPCSFSQPVQQVTPAVGSSLQLDHKYVLWKCCQSHRCMRSPLLLQGILCFWLISREPSTTSSILVCKRLRPACRKQCQWHSTQSLGAKQPRPAVILGQHNPLVYRFTDFPWRLHLCISVQYGPAAIKLKTCEIQVKLREILASWRTWLPLWLCY